MVNFLPTILMQLFEVLTTATKEAHDVAVNSLRWVLSGGAPNVGKVDALPGWECRRKSPGTWGLRDENELESCFNEARTQRGNIV